MLLPIWDSRGLEDGEEKDEVVLIQDIKARGVRTKSVLGEAGPLGPPKHNPFPDKEEL